MRSSILCRERLHRILTLLDRNGGQVEVRTLERNHRVYSWEVEQAEELGWIRIFERKPAVGRPARVAEKLSESGSAKLPPWRYGVPRQISIRHWRFALESVGTMPGGYFGCKPATLVHAYLVAFRNCRSRRGASASATRLMKRRDVRLMRRWFILMFQGKIDRDEEMPDTESGIVARLRELGLI